MKITLKKLKEFKACEDSLPVFEKLFPKGGTLPDVIEKCPRADWLIWILHKTGNLSGEQVARLARICAEWAARAAAAWADGAEWAAQAAKSAGPDWAEAHKTLCALIREELKKDSFKDLG